MRQYEIMDGNKRSVHKINDVVETMIKPSSEMRYLQKVDEKNHNAITEPLSPSVLIYPFMLLLISPIQDQNHIHELEFASPNLALMMLQREILAQLRRSTIFTSDNVIENLAPYQALHLHHLRGGRETRFTQSVAAIVMRPIIQQYLNSPNPAALGEKVVMVLTSKILYPLLLRLFWDQIGGLSLLNHNVRYSTSFSPPKISWKFQANRDIKKESLNELVPHLIQIHASKWLSAGNVFQNIRILRI
ncbi:18222_t:CDS:2, partial [Funneliformis geosporum]